MTPRLHLHFKHGPTPDGQQAFRIFILDLDTGEKLADISTVGGKDIPYHIRDVISIEDTEYACLNPEHM
jgi:hypothetical protein